ncbi:hypothetical protein ABIB15_000204 [Marisediminicola sp. UYEF4]|uniref:hypothetical protein n=1 Tax=Marisediminicola sp. UYEF4 TaxID=1756384 RepID=UPI00339A72C1
MSEDRNEPASNTPPPLVPPPVRAPETRSDETVSGEKTSVDAERDSGLSVDEPVSARADNNSAEQTPVVSSDDSRFAPDASRNTGSVPAATGERDVTNDVRNSDTERTVAAPPVVASETAAQPVAHTAAQPTAVVQRDEPTRVQPTVPTVPAAQQPERIFVPPAPVAPKRKGNRGIGSLIAVVSVVIFGILYALVATIIVAIAAPGQNLLTTLTRFLTDPVFYVPGILFVVGFVLVVLLVNRAAWWAFVLGSLIVGAIVYFGTIGVQLLTENVVAMTPSAAAAAFAAYAVNPFVIAAALVARETSMWIGAAISSRGRRMKERNLTARDEYDKATAAHRAEYDRSYAA